MGESSLSRFPDCGLFLNLSCFITCPAFILLVAFLASATISSKKNGDLNLANLCLVSQFAVENGGSEQVERSEALKGGKGCRSALQTDTPNLSRPVKSSTSCQPRYNQEHQEDYLKMWVEMSREMPAAYVVRIWPAYLSWRVGENYCL